MPCLEEIPKKVQTMTISSGIPNVDAEMDIQNEFVDPEPPVVRELTQTDRLNNRLLKSFLERMNTGNGDIFQNFVTTTAPEEGEGASGDFEE